MNRWHVIGWYLLVGGTLNVVAWLARWQGAGSGLGGLALTLVAAPLLIFVPPGPGVPGVVWNDQPPPDGPAPPRG